MGLKSETIIDDFRIFLVQIYTNYMNTNETGSRNFVIFVPKL